MLTSSPTWIRYVSNGNVAECQAYEQNPQDGNLCLPSVVSSEFIYENEAVKL